MSIMFVSLILGVLILLYLYATRNYKYWQKHEFPCANGVLPGVGNLGQFFIMKTSFSECIRKIYNDNKGRSMIGFYNFMTPSLIVLEPELIKAVLQTNFSSFHANAVHIDPDLDPLLANNPFFNYGDKWVTGRKRLTYAFSNVRLKVLLESVKRVCEEFEGFLDRRLSKAGKVELELKDLFSRYTAQVVAAAGFGVDGFCFEDEKHHRSFYDIGKSFLNTSFFGNLIFAILFFVPSLGKLFKMSFLPKEVDRFFRTMIMDIMGKRRKDKVPRNDFLQLMVELERTEGDEFDLEVVASHALSFFIDGYETSSIVLSFLGFQLAAHPEIQTKLREEVVSVLAKHDGAITYDALKDMTYMDQVISESQRIIPTLGFLNKICMETCELRGSDGLVCRVQSGTEVIIPLCGLQEDPRYWNDPEVFDPERFNPDRKHSIEKFVFLPFSEGPRVCVGRRMALLQIKACLTVFLRKYSLELSPKTQLPLKMIPTMFITAPVGGLWAFIRPI